VSHVTGDLTTFVAALGQPEDSPTVQDIVVSLGGRPKVSSLKLGPDRERYLQFLDAGVDLTFKNGVLATAFFFVRPEEGHAAFTATSSLIDGSSSAPRRDDLRALLGDRVRSTDERDFYAVGERLLSLTFDGQELTRIVLMSEDPLAPSPDDVEGLELDDGGVIDPPSGDIATFVRAVGTPQSDEMLAQLLAISDSATAGEGPGMTHEKVERDGVEWLYVFLAGGVDLQFRDGVLVGSLVHISRQDRPVYQYPEDLVATLPLPTGAEQVRQRFGTPRVSSPTQVPGESFDLYHLASKESAAGRDLALSFDYRDDQVVSVTVMRRDVGGS
jgi:hypothetical protein